MRMSLNTIVTTGLPRLAWFLTADSGRGIIDARVGKDVEVGDDFLVEGLWETPFERKDFHQAACFFGSGVKTASDGRLVLVPSRALVDRVFLARAPGRIWAANSLPLLLAGFGGAVDFDADYRPASFTILKGIDRYASRIPVKHSEVREVHQFFYDPVVVEASGATDPVRLPRPPRPRFASFEEYVRHLQEVSADLLENSRSDARQRPLRSAATISQGYDSPAVSALVAELGVDIAFTSRRSNSTIAPWMSRQAAIDDGSAMAQQLGLEPKDLETSTPPDEDEELRFLAPSSADPELVFLAMTRDFSARERPTVLFTGFHGDKVWERELDEEYLGPDLRRGDTSGLNLSEIRLSAGFINVPIPFIGARSIADLNRISHSAEMSPWTLGGRYDRPIPRRILESRGIPRSSFGRRKKAVVQAYPLPRNRDLRRLFLAWLRTEHGRSTLQVRSGIVLDRLLFLAAATLERVGRLVRGRIGSTPTTFSTRSLDLPYQLHVWALEELQRRLARVLDDTGIDVPRPSREPE